MNDNFSVQSAVIGKLLRKLSVLENEMMNENIRNLQFNLDGFPLSGLLSFPKKSTTFNYY